MARYMRSDLGRGHTLLRPPMVVNQPQSVVYPPIQGRLHPTAQTATIVLQRRAQSQLGAPVVVNAPVQFVASPIATTFAPSRSGPVKSHLRGPVVIDGRPQTVYLSITLTRIRPPHAISRLRRVIYEPAVEVSEVFEGPRTTLVRSPAPRTRSFLRPPTDTIGLEDQGRIDITLAPSNRRRARWRLFPPVVIDLSPQAYYLSVTLTRIRPPGTTTYLFKPTVVVAVQPPTFYLSVQLAPSFRGPTLARLFGPAVIGPPIQPLLGPKVTLTDTPLVYFKTRSFRVIPTVVEEAERVVYAPIYGRLAPFPPLPPVHHRLSAPVVVQAAEVIRPVDVTLAPSARIRGKSRLAPPVVVNAAEAFYARPVKVTLAPAARRRARYGLAGPAVVNVILFRAEPISVTLAASRRPVVQSLLQPPTAVFPFFARPTYVTLAYSLRGKPQSVLRKPVVIDLRPQTQFVAVHLAYSRRGAPKPHLSPPAVVAQVAQPLASPIRVTLAPAARRRARYGLAGPAVVNVILFVAEPVAVHLAESRRPVAKTFLRRPAVVAPFFARPTQTTLAYSLRGQPKSLLHAPVVIDLRPQTRFLAVTLAYSLRGRPKSVLRKPAVIGVAPQTRYLSVNLTYSRRGRPVSFLREPVVIDLRPQTKFLAVTLTYSLRGRPRSFLRPAIIARPGFPGTTVTLAYSRRGQPRSILRAPQVVFPFFARATQITLAPQSRGVTHSKLSTPTAVREFFVEPLRVTLAPQPKPKARYGLAAPAIVTIPEPVLYPVATTLAYSLRGKPVYFQTGINIFPGDPLGDRGDVCGYDEAASEVCGETAASESTICGDDDAAYSVSGGDEQAT